MSSVVVFITPFIDVFCGGFYLPYYWCLLWRFLSPLLLMSSLVVLLPLLLMSSVVVFIAPITNYVCGGFYIPYY